MIYKNERVEMPESSVYTCYPHGENGKAYVYRYIESWRETGKIKHNKKCIGYRVVEDGKVWLVPNYNYYVIYNLEPPKISGKTVQSENVGKRVCGISLFCDIMDEYDAVAVGSGKKSDGDVLAFKDPEKPRRGRPPKDYVRTLSIRNRTASVPVILDRDCKLPEWVVAGKSATEEVQLDAEVAFKREGVVPVKITTSYAYCAAMLSRVYGLTRTMISLYGRPDTEEMLLAALCLAQGGGSLEYFGFLNLDGGEYSLERFVNACRIAEKRPPEDFQMMFAKRFARCNIAWHIVRMPTPTIGGGIFDVVRVRAETAAGNIPLLSKIFHRKVTMQDIVGLAREAGIGIQQICIHDDTVIEGEISCDGIAACNVCAGLAIENKPGMRELMLEHFDQLASSDRVLFTPYEKLVYASFKGSYRGRDGKYFMQRSSARQAHLASVLRSSLQHWVDSFNSETNPAEKERLLDSHAWSNLVNIGTAEGGMAVASVNEEGFAEVTKTFGCTMYFVSSNTARFETVYRQLTNDGGFGSPDPFGERGVQGVPPAHLAGLQLIRHISRIIRGMMEREIATSDIRNKPAYEDVLYVLKKTIARRLGPATWRVKSTGDDEHMICYLMKLVKR